MISFYVGQKPYIMIADLDILKHILVKDFNSFIDRPVSTMSKNNCMHSARIALRAYL